MQKDVWVSWTRPCSLCWQCLLYSPCIYIFYPLMLYLGRWKSIDIIIWHAISRSKQTLLLPDKLQSQWDLPTKRYLEGPTCKVPFRVALISKFLFLFYYLRLADGENGLKFCHYCSLFCGSWRLWIFLVNLLLEEIHVLYSKNRHVKVYTWVD